MTVYVLFDHGWNDDCPLGQCIAGVVTDENVAAAWMNAAPDWRMYFAKQLEEIDYE